MSEPEHWFFSQSLLLRRLFNVAGALCPRRAAMPDRRLRSFVAWAALAAAFVPMAHAQVVVSPSAMARLSEADANRDGRVTRTEFLAARAARFDRFDRNQDGVLTLADSPPRFIAASLSVDLADMLKVFDADKNDQVTRAEFVNGPTPTFDAADTNTDGVLDAAELKSAAARKAR
jgi:hypothetical protein